MCTQLSELVRVFLFDSLGQHVEEEYWKNSETCSGKKQMYENLIQDLMLHTNTHTHTHTHCFA